MNPLPLERFSVSAPIGIFDSGLGGLSILSAIRALLPDESLYFCADSRYAPYGEREVEFIVQRAFALSAWLLEQSAKALVVACNTATAQVIEALRARFAVPVVGVEPGIKPAAALSVSRVAGVLATASTLHSQRFRQLLAAHGRDCQFILQPGYGLVEAIERGDLDSPGLLKLLERYLTPMLAAGADTLALGCTHYSFLTAVILKISGKQMQLIDTATAVARQVARVLDMHNRRAPANATPRLCFYSTGDGQPQQRLLPALLGIHAQVECVRIPNIPSHTDAVFTKPVAS
ncbi:Glutamate racemase [Candidatus Glomeribacter gigasporarum BEG34]|uniref:Glutamate racemase n=1 Tax=Candidatus Glomeribacter gigasporarum BEG34 TaxID=1070319 RepID=G2J9U1_9BURK|nr:glutamate racemase [Candidatus Glomeribacter gigasporarum]CCD29538.1 Glutamate racemase [Candidatus Glomeribacter gigasporarum BEG34]